MKLLEQKAFIRIEELEQLKALSDPLRTQILTILIEKAYTGQQLSKMLAISRSKIHYHLNELEKHHFIQVVQTEEKHGFEQKFYKAVARSFLPSDKLLPFQTEVGDYYRQVAFNILGRTRLRVMEAPSESFQMGTGKLEEWPRVLMQVETKINEQQLLDWIKRYRELVNEFKNFEVDENGKWFYLTTIGFHIDEPYFDHEEGEDQ